MERIKQALERARQERVGRAELSATPRSAGLDEAEITYTQTKVHAVTEEQLRRNRVICGDDNTEATVAYKILRTQVLQRMMTNGWNTLALTSTLPNQGKSLTSINLAISVAREIHHTVLLVDLDMRFPSIHTYFNYEPAIGVEDYLLNNASLNDIMINPGIPRLVVLPCRRPVSNSSELLASPKMADLVEALKTRYPSRFVLFDLPPILAGDDVLAFTPHVDSVLLVVEDNATRKEDLKQALDLLHKVDVLGTVLNKSSETVGTYY